MTQKGDVIAIYGFGWAPEIPYFSKRRAIMEAPGSGDFDGKMMQSALKLVSDENLEAVILNSTLQHSRKAALGQKYADRYGFAKAPLQIVAGAEIYVKNNTAYP